MKSRTALLLVIAIVLILGVFVWRMPRTQETATEAKPPVKPIGAVIEIKAPLGLPRPPVPAENPPTAETIELGRRLYYDPQLSADNTISCASCHKPEAGFADNHPVSTGVNGKTGARNSPTVANSAYFTTQFWDGRAASLEKQAEGPVENPLEMAHTLAGVEKKLMADPSYREAFRKAFGTDQITYEMVEKAIATFERTVLVGNSPFDRFYYGGDKRALTPAAQRGLKVFMDKDKGNCALCHTIGQDYALFTDNLFHNIGIGADTKGNLADLGRYEVTKNDADRGAFRTPTMRNIALTAPYMHDGSLKTLKEVIDYYIGGGNTNPQLSRHMKPLDHLSFPERADLLAFLESLNGEVPPNVGPPETQEPVASAAKP